MSNPDFSQTFILQTDVSGTRVGAVLRKKDKLWNDHAIAYYSRKFLECEQKSSNKNAWQSN